MKTQQKNNYLIMENSEILHQLASEKTMRIRLEEECGKLQELIISLESQLKLKSQEIQSLKSDHEKIQQSLFQQIELIKGKFEVFQQENENLKKTVGSIKAEYFSLTDKDIAKANKIDELYVVIRQYQDDIKDVEGELFRAQDELHYLKNEHAKVLQKFEVTKLHKFVQADPSPLTSRTGLCGHSKYSPDTSIFSLTKTKSQILALEKSKSRIDLQIRLLSKFD